MRGRVVRALITGTVLVLVACAPSAEAALPGQNGRIAFDSGVPTVVKTMNPDGTGQATLRPGSEPAWSPGGGQIAFTKPGTLPSGCCRIGSSVYRMPADGSSETLVAQGETVQWNEDASYSDASWAPDGNRIAMTFTECTDVCGYSMRMYPSLGTISFYATSPTWRPYGDEIAYVRTLYLPGQGVWGVRSNGAANHEIWSEYDPQRDDDWPVEDVDYSPEGGRILFSSPYPAGGIKILSVPSTGGTPVPLTNNASDDLDAVWSPDGTKIAFSSNRDGNFEIYTMNADGTNQTRITNSPANDFNPSWQPLPYPNYVRPKGATPVRVSLVPAYAQCTASNRQHGPPLAYGSCAPPAEQSSALTVGGSMTGFVRYKTIVGNPATPEVDEADIALRVQISDVRENGTLADYGGEVEAEAMARLTDRTAGDPVTATDVRFPLTTQCTPTAATNIGSTCSLTTTLDTLIPGAIVEGARTVLQLSQVQVIDGGADADTATEPNNVFLRQGVFVP